MRRGKASESWFKRYYGTVDATPLYLVLLSEVWRWTDDTRLVTALREPAMRALEWIDRYGDRDGDGFVEYEKRSKRGLDNQSWKDSHDSQQFADGRVAQTPIAPCEVQGYVFDAKQRMAEIAREVWRDRELGDRLDREAKELRRAFNEAYWVDGRGGYYALALDGDKRPVDSMCSNMGHLLWSGIVPSERADAVVDRLMGEELWSGWGVRTMSSGTPATTRSRTTTAPSGPTTTLSSPSGSRGTSGGRRRSGSCSGMLEAAAHFDHQLPEVFAGMPRAETPFPIAYPTAARPQAWAAATPVLLLRVLLGLEPTAARHTLETGAPASCRRGRARPAFRRAVLRPPLDVRVDDGRIPVGDRDENRRHQPGVVPGAADRLRRHRVDRLAARRRARGCRPRRHALRLGRLAHEGEARRRCTARRRAS